MLRDGVLKRKGQVRVPQSGFSEKIDVEYNFELSHVLKAQVTSQDSVIGSVQFNLHQVITAPEKSLELENESNPVGILIIQSETKPSSFESISMNISTSFTPSISNSSYFMILYSCTPASPICISDCRPFTSTLLEWSPLQMDTTYFKQPEKPLADKKAPTEKKKQKLSEVMVSVYELGNQGEHQRVIVEKVTVEKMRSMKDILLA